MIEFLKNNISWLKDLLTLLLVGVGTVIGILTYRRAKATFLQPIRTEVIKKQSNLLSKLLQPLNHNNQSFKVGLNYINLIQANVMLTLRDYGFAFKKHKMLFEKTKNNVVGWTSELCLKNFITS